MFSGRLPADTHRLTLGHPEGLGGPNDENDRGWKENKPDFRHMDASQQTSTTMDRISYRWRQRWACWWSVCRGRASPRSSSASVASSSEPDSRKCDEAVKEQQRQVKHLETSDHWNHRLITADETSWRWDNTAAGPPPPEHPVQPCFTQLNLIIEWEKLKKREEEIKFL